MDMKTLQEANSLASLISSSEMNIKSWEDLFESGQITCTSDTKMNPVYLTGQMKNKVRDTIITHHKEQLEGYEKKLEEL